MSDEDDSKFRNELYELWHTKESLLCQMIDGKFAILISGPSVVDVGEDTWKYAFQVRGESGVRWLNYNEIQIINGITGTYLRQV